MILHNGFNFQQGGHPRPWLMTQRRGSRFVLISRLITVTYLLWFSCQFSAMGSGKPKNHHAVRKITIWFSWNYCFLMSFFKQVSNQTFSFPFDVTSMPVRFSQSGFPLSTEEEWAASERFYSSSKDVERFPSHSFSLLVIQFLLSGLTGVFLHVRCIPHQNSQRCFWASVWFMLDSSPCHDCGHQPHQLTSSLASQKAQAQSASQILH